MKKYECAFSSELWLYPTEAAAWHFITLPKKESEAIKKTQIGPRRGWGSVPVSVTIGKTTWQTSIFPDKRLGAYVLPVKATVRAKEGLRAGRGVRVSISLR
ncbi:MAG: DUF1905 domain-containing protein [Patescibacteria group bacterium]